MGISPVSMDPCLDLGLLHFEGLRDATSSLYYARVVVSRSEVVMDAYALDYFESRDDRSQVYEISRNMETQQLL